MSAIKTEPATPIVAESTTAADLHVTATISDLKRASTLLARVADRKSTMPVLAHALVRVDERGTMLVATDLNLCAIVRTSWRGARGGYAVNAKQLADTVKNLPGNECEIQRKGLAALALTSGSVVSLLRGIPDREFPKVPDDRADDLPWCDTDPKAFASALESVAYAICKDETRFHLSGVFLQSTGTETTVVATDGHRLSLTRGALTTAATKSGVIIPEKAVREIARLLTDRSHKGDTCRVAFKGPHLFVRYGDTTLIAKLIDAQFPPYQQVIPTSYSRLACVERKPLIAALKRAAIVCTETHGVKLAFATGTITLVSDHPEMGEQRESLPDDSGWTMGRPCEAIGVNVRYLLDSLGEIECDHVTLAFSDELAPILVRSTHDAVEHKIEQSPHVAVIMPMRI